MTAGLPSRWSANMPPPDSLPWMGSVDAKIARAGEHLEAINTEIFAFLKTTKRNNVLKIDGERAWITCWVDDPFPRMGMGVLVGDVIFNLRSALDHLACGLIRSGDANGKCRSTKFPISLTPQYWEDH